jgi:PTH1 family peptidyl-tRNA hydrolase
MLLIVGLGNPGPKYERNRHNIGFMAADEIVRRHSFGAWRSRFQSMVAEGNIAGDKAMVIKPMTYMNESGRAVGEAMRFFKLAPPDIIVIHDELDLVPGKIRVKRGGGHAGHNGLRSITAHIGEDFCRVRVGIGHPGDKNRVHGYVLSDFAKAEQPLLERTVDAIAAHIGLLVEGNESSFMSRTAHDIFPPPPKPPRPEGGEPPNTGEE